MQLPFYIAKRYFGNYLSFKSGKKWNAIQLLTFISIIASFTIALASILVLSVFNGLTFLLGDINAVFYPELKITPATGKVFALTEEEFLSLQSIEGIEHIAKVIEEIALFEKGERQVMGVVKGVDENYADVSRIEEGIYRGNFLLQNENENYAVAGLGISNKLALNVSSPFSHINIYVPQRKKRVSFGPSSLLGKFTLKPSGEFAIQKEFDQQYVFVPIEVLRPQLYYDNEVSYLEVKLTAGASERKVKKQIEKRFNHPVTILNREQQNETWYKVMRFEKWMSFAILSLIMLIASFNLFSSLTMMVLDKQKDISILKSMGMRESKVGAIFRWQALLISLVGGIAGALLAAVIIVLQQKFGFVPLKGSFVVDSYPIRLEWFDVLITILSIVAISWLSSIIPAKRAQTQLLLDQ